MRRISVDFNTMDSEPIDLVKIGRIGTPNAAGLVGVHTGEIVLIFDEEMEVEATVQYDAEHRYWLARPDWSTRHNLETQEVVRL